jgi:GDP-L-fucose synthase
MEKLKIYIAGHKGMVGSALTRFFKAQNNLEIITRNKDELDLTNQLAVKNFFKTEKIDQVYLAAAKVGGIYANNNYPADFIYENLMIQSNIIHSAFLFGVKKLLFLGSSCIYPLNANQPLKEGELLSGKLEPTNEPYAIAKIAGIKLCESYNRQYSKSHGVDYRSVMPTNLYGPGDNYHPINSHVIPSLIRRFHEAKASKSNTVVVWGSGKPKREFLYVDDMAIACVHFMNIDYKIFSSLVTSMSSHINIGSGEEYTIRELAEIIKEVVGYEGEIDFDKSKLDGNPQKKMDCQLAKKLGWQSKINLREGLIKTYKQFLKI